MRISQQIFPRVVAIITTISKEGKPNAMTASFLIPISFNPKYIAVSISPKRYTFKLLREVPEFGVNILEKRQKELAWLCGATSGRNINKFEEFNIKMVKSDVIKPPLIDCPISFECILEFMKEFGDHYIVIGKVVKEHVRKKLFEPLLHYWGDKFNC